MSPDPRYQDISGLAPDDQLFAVALTYNGLPLNLATVTSVTAYLKPTQGSPDSGAKTYSTGTGLTVTDQANGKLNWAIPQSDLAGMGWYRFGIVDGTGKKATALYGHFTIDSV